MSVPFDRTELLAAYFGDRELLAEIVGVFMDVLPSQLEEARRAVAAQDARAIRASMCKMRGTTGNFRARAAGDAARALESADTGDDAAAKLAVLERELAALVAALQEFSVAE